MKLATGIGPLVVAAAGLLCMPALAQESRPTPAPTSAPTHLPKPAPSSASAPAAPPKAPAPTPAPPAPPAPPAGEGGDGISIRIREVRPATPAVDYDGAIMRVRQRAARASRPARNPEEAKWQQGVDNLSVDPITRRPMGVYLFMVRY